MGAMDDSQKRFAPTSDNIEDLEVKIAILASNPSKLASMVHFLNRRGWPTTIHSQVGPLIEVITKEKPDFVLVSMNHPSPKLDMLPQLLEQTFSVTPIVFAETSESTVLARLQNSKVKYKLIGTTSGPSMHRYLRKVLLELLGGGTGAEEDGSVRMMSSEPVDQKIHVAGNNRDSSATVISGTASDSQKTMIQTGPAANQFSQTQTMGTMGSGGSGAVGSRKSLGAILGSKKTAASDSTKDSAAARQHLMNLLNSQDGDGSSAGGKKQLIVPTPGDSSVTSPLSAAAQALASAQAKGGTTGNSLSAAMQAKAAAQTSSNSKDQKGGPHAPAANPKKPLVHVSPAVSRPDSSLPKTNGESPNLASEGGRTAAAPVRPKVKTSEELAAEAKAFAYKDPLFQAFVQAAKAAVDASTQPLPKMKTVKELMVVPIDSQETYGYGVVTLSMPIAEAEGILEKFTIQLARQIQDMKIPVELEETFVIATPEFRFLDAVGSNGVFGEIQSFPSGTEIAFGFFKTPFRIQPPEAEDDTMTKIDVESISTEIPVNFKAYVRMARNDKYLLYLKDGRKLLERQKKTLKRHNVLVFHVSKHELVKFRAYTAVGFFSRIAQKQTKGAA